jgi:hypothetical protein
MQTTMTDDEKYFFDLQGYLVLRDVIDPDMVRRVTSWSPGSGPIVSHSGS